MGSVTHTIFHLCVGLLLPLCKILSFRKVSLQGNCHPVLTLLNFQKTDLSRLSDSSSLV